MSGRAELKQRKEQEEREQEEKSRRRWERNYTSEDSGLNDDSFFTFYCSFCGHYAIIVDCDIGKLPKRGSDGSFVLDETKHVFKRQMNDGQTKVIRRDKGVEKQYRFHCKECDLPLCYRSAPKDKDSKYSYFIKDALTNDPKTVVQKVKEVEQAQAVLRSAKQEDEDQEA